MENLFHEEVDKLHELLDDSAAEGDVDLAACLNVSVINSLWTIAMGEKFERGDPKLMTILDLMDRALRETSPQSPMALVMPHPGMVKLPVLRDWSGFTTARSFFRSIEALLREKMEEHKRTLDVGNPRDLMDVLLLRVNDGENNNSNDSGDSGVDEGSGEEDQGSISAKKKRMEQHSNDLASPFHPAHGDITIINIFVDLFTAGMETTVSTLCWTFLYLIHHPEVQEKVHEEIDRIVGKDRLPSLSDDLPYVSAVLHESHRMTGFVFLGMPHYVTADIDIPAEKPGQPGMRIPAGATVMPNLFHVMNDPDYWDEPREFRPQRFVKTDLDGERHFVPDERVIPFSIGRRQCPGQALADKELFIFFACIMQRFRVEAGRDGHLPGIDLKETDPAGNLRSPPK